MADLDDPRRMLQRAIAHNEELIVQLDDKYAELAKAQSEIARYAEAIDLLVERVSRYEFDAAACGNRKVLKLTTADLRQAAIATLAALGLTDDAG